MSEGFNSAKHHDILAPQNKTKLISRSDVFAEGLFGNDAADDENRFALHSYFVDNPEYRSFESNEVNFSVARGRKGVGKSAALFNLAFLKRQDEQSIVSEEFGSTLITPEMHETDNQNELMAKWREAIAHSLCTVISETIDIPQTPTELEICERFSTIPKGKNKGFIGLILNRISIDLKIVKFKDSKLSYQDLLKSYISENKNKTFWLFIDDIDATFTSTANEIKILSSFFTACRNISSKTDRLFIRAAIRQDVWATISHTDESLDKCEQYMVDLKWSRTGTRKVIAKRIRHYISLKHSGLNNNSDLSQIIPEKYFQNLELTNKYSDKQIMTLVFPETFPIGTGTSLQHNIIHRLSGGRPRWALQLCKMAQAEGRKNDSQSNVIKFGLIKQILPRYSRFRVTDIIREHRHQCPQLEYIIPVFEKGDAETSFSNLMQIIDKSIDTSTVQINGKSISGAIDIIKLLFRVGFLEAVSCDKKSEVFDFSEKPHLLNDIEVASTKYDWQIHPSYRAALGLGFTNENLTNSGT